MSIDEGYIKYKSFWNKEAIEMNFDVLKELNAIRSKLMKYNMIGKIPNGPGFGNISVRIDNEQFYISATNTGHLSTLTIDEFAVVSDVNIDTNSVWCSGMSNASSESMSHAVIYRAKPFVNAVIHIHHKTLWNKLKNVEKTTHIDTSYGTPELAKEIAVIVKENNNSRLLVLGGHEDGIISYGNTLIEAFEAIEQEYLNL